MTRSGLVTGLSVAASVAGAFAPAIAEAQVDEQAEDGWSWSVTPRAQALYFTPHVVNGLSEFQTMPTYGGTITASSPDQRFAVVATGFYGQADGDYINHQNSGPPGTLGYHAERSDGFVALEYKPVASNVTFIAGVRAVKMAFEEENAAQDFSSIYEINAVALEVGARITGKIEKDSKHTFTAQGVVGVGSASYQEATTALTPIDDTHLVTSFEVAAGYNYAVTDNFYIGARVRAFYLGTWSDEGRPSNQFGERSGGAYGPELNVTVVF